MTQAVAQIDGVTGSNPPNGVALSLGATITVTNVNNGGEVSYLWEFVDRPENSAAAFAAPNTQTTTFVADVEGTYVIRLTVNAALSDEATDTVIAGVSQILTEERIPGATETTQASTLRGWAEALNRWLRRADRFYADAGKQVVVITSGASRGQCVTPEGLATLRAGYPEQADSLDCGLALASNLSHVRSAIYVVEGTPGGGTVVGAGALGVVRREGLFGPLVGAPVLGDPVFVDDSAQVSLTPGTYRRQIGLVIGIVGADYYCYINSSMWGAGSTAQVLIDAATAPGEFPAAVPIQALPNTGLKFMSPTAATDSDTVVEFEPTDIGNTVRVTGLGSVALGEDGVLLGPTGNPLGLLAGAGQGINLAPNNSLTRAWTITSPNGELVALGGGGQLISNVATPLSATDAATKAYVDTIGETLRWGNQAVPVAGTTSYLDPGWYRAISDANERVIVTGHTGTITKLFVAARVAGGGDAIDFTVRIAGAGTLATVSLSGGATYATATVSVAVSAGDLLSVEVKTGAGSVSPTDITFAANIVR